MARRQVATHVQCSEGDLLGVQILSHQYMGGFDSQGPGRGHWGEREKEV